MIGYERHEAPPEASLIIQRMADECERLKVEIGVLFSEKYDFEETINDFKHFDLDKKEEIMDAYCEKITQANEQYENILHNLRERGYEPC